MSLSILDPNCPAWYRRYVEGKRVKVRKPRKGVGLGRKKGAIMSRDRRNKTGCIGISLVRTNLPSGRRCRFFAAHLGATNRKFNIDTLGRQEAWRRALRLRAEFEKRAMSILKMRHLTRLESRGSNPRIALQRKVVAA